MNVLNYSMKERLNMTNLEIKEKIDTNNKIIEDIMNPGKFVLNNTVYELLQENRKLQNACKHHFVNGYCEYCYLEETL